MHEKLGTILLVTDKKTKTEYCVNMTVRTGKLTLRLTIQKTYIQKLLNDIDVEKLKELEGRQVVINLCGGFMYQANISHNKSNTTYVPFNLSS